MRASIWRRLFGSFSKKPMRTRSPRRRPLWLESLEDRLTPAAPTAVLDTTDYSHSATVRVQVFWDTNDSGTIDDADDSAMGSGALIDDYHVLTAAHVIYDTDNGKGVRTGCSCKRPAMARPAPTARRRRRTGIGRRAGTTTSTSTWASTTRPTTSISACSPLTGTSAPTPGPSATAASTTPTLSMPTCTTRGIPI